MNDLLNTLSREAKNIQLSNSEKTLVRERLVNFVETNPVRNKEALRLNNAKAIVSPWSYNWFSLFINHKTMPLALIALLFVGGGVSFAAQGSLPGDALYPVKVNFNEKIEATLSVSAESNANLEAKLAERRLIEAEKLAGDNKLDAETSLEIKQRFEAHALRVDERIEKLSDRDVLVALDVASRFETSLKAHEAVLAKLESKTESADASGNSLTLATAMSFKADLHQETLGDSLRSEIEKASQTRVSLGLQVEQDASITEAERKAFVKDECYGCKDEPVSPTRPQEPAYSMELATYFKSQIESKLNAKGIVPIEGFTPQILLKYLSVLEDVDFNNVVAFGGTHIFNGKDLVFKRSNTNTTSSADGSLQAQGYGTLLTNVSARLNLKITNKESVDSLVWILLGNKTPSIPIKALNSDDASLNLSL